MKRFALILAVLLAFIGDAWGASRTFGAGGDHTDLLAALDAASNGDSLIQTGAASVNMSGAKSYTLTGITVVGNDTDVIKVIPLGTTHDFTITNGGTWKFVDCASLSIWPSFNNTTAILQNCTTYPDAAATNPHASPYNLGQIQVTGGDVTFTAEDCLFDWVSTANYHGVQFVGSHTLTGSFTRCTFEASTYCGPINSGSDMFYDDCTFPDTGGHALLYRVGLHAATNGMGTISFRNCDLSGTSSGLRLTDAGGTVVVDSLSMFNCDLNSNLKSWYVAPAYQTVLAKVNTFCIDSCRFTSYVYSNSNPFYGVRLTPGTSLRTTGEIRDCSSPSARVQNGGILALYIDGGFDGVEMVDNDFASIGVWVAPSATLSSDDWLIEGNTFGGGLRSVYGFVGCLEDGEVTGNTITGNIAMGIVLTPSDPETEDARSGNNLVHGNTVAVATDSCHATPFTFNSEGNKAYNNSGTVASPATMHATAFYVTRPNAIYNNSMTFGTGGHAMVSAFNVPEDSVLVANNAVFGTLDYVYATGAYADYDPVKEDKYPDYGTIFRALRTLDDSSSVGLAFTWGYSEMGFPLIGIKLSDTPGTAENEPSFAFTFAMHGSEWAAATWGLAFADSLVAAYATESRVSDLVDATETYLLWPNPDGFMTWSYHNANAADLWRSDWPTADGVTRPTRSKEQGYLYDFFKENEISLHGDFHNSASGIYYPFANSGLTPGAADVTTMIALGDAFDAAYACRNFTVQRAGLSGSYTGSIIDWVYRYGGSMSVGAIEFGIEDPTPVPQPSADLLHDEWLCLSDATMALMEAGMTGLQGVVTEDATSGSVSDVDVNVQGYTYGNVRTDRDGYYFRPIVDGTYTFSYTETGYTTGTENKTISGLTTHNEVLAGPDDTPIDDWVPGTAQAPHVWEGSTCHVGSREGWLDSGAESSTDFSDSTAWNMKWGGITGLSGITANSFGAVNVGLNPPTGGVVLTGSAVPFLSPYASSTVLKIDAVASTVEELLSHINAGILPESDPADITTYYGVKAPNSASQESQLSVVLEEWKAMTVAERDKTRLLIR